MSHAPERSEKDCLNCGTMVQGRYCQQCGQENIVPRESFWSLVIHFFYDITHFDSKFFDSLRYLLFRPGFLSAEFMKGRRARYLNPVRMYVFTSAFFFIIFFSFLRSGNAVNFSSPYEGFLSQAQRDSAAASVRKKLSDKPADVYLTKQLELLEDTSQKLTWTELLIRNEDFSIVNFTGKKFRSLQAYDSVQQSLPEKDRDGWLTRRLSEREIEINTRYAGEPREAWNDLIDLVLHKIPYLLFISLPLFALILKLLYVRRNKFYYADHAIFSIHHYIFSFLLLLFVFLFNKLGDMTGYSIFNFIMAILILLWFFYLYKGMRNFYGQGRGKTILKYLLLNMLGFVVNATLLVIFFFLGFLMV